MLLQATVKNELSGMNELQKKGTNHATFSVKCDFIKIAFANLRNHEIFICENMCHKTTCTFLFTVVAMTYF